MATEQGTHTFELDGKLYKLHFGINALCEIEEAFGCKVQDMHDRLSPPVLDAAGKPTLVKVDATGKPVLGESGAPIPDPKGQPLRGQPAMKDLRELVRCGLVEHWPGETDPTARDAGRIVDAVGLTEMARHVGEAFQAAFPSAAKAAGGEGSGGKAKKK